MGFLTTFPCSINTVLEPRRRLPLRSKAILKFTEGKPNRQTPAIRQHIYEKFGVDLSERCIQLWLKAEGLHPYHRERQLRLLQQHKRKRVVFARRFMNHDWMTTLFTDEKLLISEKYNSDKIEERVGSGDSFMAALIHGILKENPDQQILEERLAALESLSPMSSTAKLYYLPSSSGRRRHSTVR